MMHEKRSIERFPLVFPVRLKSAGIENAESFTRDISSKGAFIRTSKPLACDAKVELAVTLPSGEIFLNVTGKVVMVEKEGMAIQFNRSSIVPVSKVTQ